MSQSLEVMMYQVGQVFLIPTLLVITIMFFYSFYALGAFLVQGWQRKRSSMSAAGRGYPLLLQARKQPDSSDDDLDVIAHKMLETPRLATRIAPMLGLVATMIPMGPALKGLSNGNLAQVSDNLAVAFSAVILALIAASITYWIVSVKRRWLAEELAWLMAQPQRRAAAAAGTREARHGVGDDGDEAGAAA